MTIASLSARLLRAELRRSWGPEAPANHVIVTTVTADDGATGTGFAWTPTVGPRAVRSLLRDDLAPLVVGLPEQPDAVWDRLWKALHEGGQGLTTVALAGVDLALWDLQARRAGTSVDRLLGRVRDRVETYGSGVNLHYEAAELVAQVQRFVDAGHTAVKIKVGRPDLADDVARVRAVREVLGPDRRLMVDANQRWDLPTARRAVQALSEFDLSWVEEPLRAEDLAGHRQLRDSVDVPVAVGENLHTAYRVAEYLRAGAVDVLQPNIVRVGGITPFRRIAALARTHSVALAPHLLPELSAQVALTLPEPVLVEDIEHASLQALGLLTDEGPVEFGPAWAAPRGRPGLGFQFVDGDLG
ncbi:mandelate racemase/muconate lactonizing enzyme family protein [Ornithinicoccus halotolerans]|uniref:mandelate racemase/muconate lactonizing enzyme family protein n=1 Tax=Ornithinicoccus halotolerans TaxID=1748220 RepID=UPI001E5BF328|nr:mandelate racemase/muconate lactonizing enzyme family protein [Ornithinicoccus halotolerans]